uniref:Late embryogenesis abundant n=1 Tax=Cleistogenes songorica TaxID=121774 RepID=A0A2S1WLQ3_9POAL|nr:late embryogenesis abundant [Cleistogenes songorica]
MSSSEDVTVTERGKNKDNNEKEGGGGFIDKVKDFIHDIGEKIEEAVGFGKPTADVSGIHIPHISLHRADLVVDVLIKNPNPVPIPLVDIDYLIDSDGRKLVSGLIPDAGTIHAHGQETVKIPISLVFDDIKSAYKDIQPGSIIPYLVRVVLLVDVPIIGRIKIPLQKSGEIPVPYKPDVDVEKIKFHRFSFEETTATLHLRLENKNDFDLGRQHAPVRDVARRRQHRVGRAHGDRQDREAGDHQDAGALQLQAQGVRVRGLGHDQGKGNRVHHQGQD